MIRNMLCTTKGHMYMACVCRWLCASVEVVVFKCGGVGVQVCRWWCSSVEVMVFKCGGDGVHV